MIQPLGAACTCGTVGAAPNDIRYGYQSTDFGFTLTSSQTLTVSGSFYTECGTGITCNVWLCSDLMCACPEHQLLGDTSQVTFTAERGSSAAGQDFLMWSAVGLATRGLTVSGNTRLVVVAHEDGMWKYDSGSGLVAFNLRSDDVLVRCGMIAVAALIVAFVVLVGICSF